MTEEHPHSQESTQVRATPQRTPSCLSHEPALTTAAATKTNAENEEGGAACGGGGTNSRSNSRGAIVTCESPRCNKNPSFARRGQTRRRFCKRHAEPGMMNIYYKYCDWNEDQCIERASFEASGKLRCLRHCEPGMRPRNNICQVEGGGCTRQSSYGVEGGKPVLCTWHRLAGMVQVRTKTCKHPGCEKIPSYGYPCKSRLYCKSHALEGMVYSAGRRCRFRGCSAPGTFNYPGRDSAGSFCKDHKEEGMLDVTPKKCESAECNYSANFGDTTQRTRRFCARHKLEGMLSYQELWSRLYKEPDTGQVHATSVEKSRTEKGTTSPSPQVTATVTPSSQAWTLQNPTAPISSGSTTNAQTTDAGVSDVGMGSSVDRDSSISVIQATRKSVRNIVDGPDRPRKAQGNNNIRRAKKTRTEMLPSDQVAAPPADIDLSISATVLHPQGFRSPTLVGASPPSKSGEARGAPQGSLQMPLVDAPAVTSPVIDLDFLAAAAVAATPTPESLGSYLGGPSMQDPAATAVVSLRCSEARDAQAQPDDPNFATSSTAASTDVNGDTPSTGVASRNASTAAASAAAGTTAGASAVDEGSLSMPAYSASRTTPASTAPVTLDFDLAGGIEPVDADETEEETFLAFLIHSVDPSNPKTLRVRGAMMSRLKGVGRATTSG